MLNKEKNTSDTVYFSNFRKEMLEFIPCDAKRVLDVGCAEGNFSFLVKERNKAEVWGVEKAEKPAQIASAKLDKVIIGGIENMLKELPEKYFDCVVFNDVLEHIVNPEEILEGIKSTFSNRGVIVASIPNVRYIGNIVELLFKKDWKYKDGGILDKTHLRFFTEKSIRRMFENAGYEIIKMKGINTVKTFNTRLLVFLTLGFYSDIKYLEFAIVAKYKK